METAKTLIVGASGQVGGVMMGVVGGGALGTSRVGREGWLRMDLADVRVAALDGVELDAVYCVGGMTHVDGCEAEPELAWRTHALGPGVLAAYARRRGVPFVYISTEYVFDGAVEDAGPYAEEARTHPLSVYGKTKLEGEQRVMEAHEGALVVRTTVVYGPDERRMNAVYGVMRNLAAGKRMRVPEDQITTPTYSRDLVGAAIGLVKAGGERGVACGGARADGEAGVCAGGGAADGAGCGVAGGGDDGGAGAGGAAAAGCGVGDGEAAEGASGAEDADGCGESGGLRGGVGGIFGELNGTPPRYFQVKSGADWT